MSKMKKLLVVLTVMVSVVAAGFVIAASTITAGKTVEVTTPQKMTSAALGKGTVIGTIAKGTSATVVKISGAYANVKLYNSGLSGWVKTSGLKIATLQPQTIGNISKISSEWLASNHGKVPNGAYAASRGAGCAPCHSGNGLEKYTDATPFTPNIDTKDSAQFKFDPHNVVLPTQIGCATCHQGYGASILVSGKVPAKLNVYSGGKEDLNVGNANALCLSCHNGRRDIKTLQASWTTPGATKTTSYPHHAWGATVSGKGGAEIAGVTYAQSTAHQGLGCIGCHMTKKAGYTSHTFKPEITTCKQCHKTATSIESLLDNSATKKELEAGLTKLEGLILAKVPTASKVGTDNSTAPLVMKETNAKITSTELQTIPAEILVGCYNYAIVQQELTLGAKGAHNPKYIKALLSESIKAIEAMK